MSQTATFYLANWEPLKEIVPLAGGSEAIWSNEHQAVDTKLLVEQAMSDAHQHLSAWQSVADYYRLLAQRIEDDEQVDSLGTLLNGFGILFDESPCDLDRLDELEPKPLPKNSYIATYSISPSSVRQLLSTCFDIDWESIREPGEAAIQELAQSDDLTWIQSFDEFMEFCR
jgi:hypothetical protein